MTIHHLAQVPKDEDDFFGIVSLSCAGIWDGTPDDAPADGDLQCNGIITVNTADVKKANQDFSSIAFSGLAPIDVESSGNVNLGETTSVVVTGSNGAWGKTDNIRDITFTTLAGSLVGGVFEFEIQYKTRGFNPV